MDITLDLKDALYNVYEVPISGINKVIGRTYGFHNENTIGKIFPKLVNSILIGYKSTNKKTIELYAYGDYNGKEFRNYICEVKHTDNINIEISKTLGISSTYLIEVIINDNTLFREYYKQGVNVNDRLSFGYMLLPYFGGRSTAPQDIKIGIELYNNEKKVF